MLGYNAISRYNCLGLDFDGLESLLWLWHHFLSQFRHHFWSALDALFVSKKQTGLPRVPQGAPAPLLPTTCGYLWELFLFFFFTCFSCFWWKNVCTWHTSLLFSILGVHWVLLGMGSYAIRLRICSPNTRFTFCIFSYNRFPGESIMGPFGHSFD